MDNLADDGDPVGNAHRLMTTLHGLERQSHSPDTDWLVAHRAALLAAFDGRSTGAGGADGVHDANDTRCDVGRAEGASQ